MKGATRPWPLLVVLVVISIHAPAKGATAQRKALTRWAKISIHAPAKGATTAVLQLTAHWYISIHAPAKGATENLLLFAQQNHKFQSTLPRRERPQTYRIRALHLYFNPRSREGSDEIASTDIGGNA